MKVPRPLMHVLRYTALEWKNKTTASVARRKETERETQGVAAPGATGLFMVCAEERADELAVIYARAAPGGKR